MHTGLILMTALPPTKGHKHLINFAVEYLKTVDSAWELYVIINSRPNEPIRGIDRYAAFRDTFRDYPNVFIHLHNVNMPQEPADHPEFWAIWRKLVIDKLAPYTDEVDYVFASEEYGTDLAKELKATFVPCDIYREINPIHATKVRDNLMINFNQVLPAMQKKFRKTITLFGPESVGKTTMAKTLANSLTFQGYYVPEWARGYLELKSVGTEVTDQKMEIIAHAQLASQRAVEKFIDKPFIFRDTDLWSTYGYHILWNGNAPEDLIDLAWEQSADLYILMNDQIPFTPDPLRYGGTKRESDIIYWRDLLVNHGLNYYQVMSVDPDRQAAEIRKECFNFFNNSNNIRFDR